MPRIRVLMAASLAAATIAWSGVACAGELKPAPDFSVRLLDNRTVRLQEFRGHPLLVDFWATWCVPCRAGMPDLDAAQKRYAKQGLVVIGLSVDEDGPEVVKPFVQKLGISYRIAMADDKVLDQFGPIRSVPVMFFINRQGEMVRRITGYIDRETLDSYLKELF